MSDDTEQQYRRASRKRSRICGGMKGMGTELVQWSSRLTARCTMSGNNFHKRPDRLPT